MKDCLSRTILPRGADFSPFATLGMKCRSRGLFRLSEQCFFVWLRAVSSSRPEVFHDVARRRGQGWPLGHRAPARRAASLTAATRDITLEQAGLNQPCRSDRAARCPAISATGNALFSRSPTSRGEPTSHSLFPSSSWAVPFCSGPKARKLVSGGTERLHTTMPHARGRWGPGGRDQS